MISQLKNTLEIIKKINQNKLIKDKINPKEIIEQEKNLKDLKTLLNKYSRIISKIKEKKQLEINDLDYFFAHIHASLIDLIWHLDQMDNLLFELAKVIPNNNKPSL